MNSMLLIILIVLTIIFLIISLFHLYWAFGGTVGKTESVPVTEKGTLLFEPGFMPCLVVGLGFLFLIFLLYLPSLDLVSDTISSGILWLVMVVFLLRVIGDFNYVGLFKKVKNTTFSRNDNRYFVPLCFLIALLILVKNLAD